MSEKSKIQWTDDTDATPWRAKRCSRCKMDKAVSEFGKDSTRHDGLGTKCNPCRKEMYRASYVKKGRKSKKGCRFVAARDGDKKQARRRVNHLIQIGLLPNPNALACSKCGHVGADRRDEYHHHLGYSVENQEKVVAVCTICHAAEERTWERRDRNEKGYFYGPAK